MATAPIGAGCLTRRYAVQFSSAASPSIKSNVSGNKDIDAKAVYVISPGRSGAVGRSSDVIADHSYLMAS